MVSSGGVVVSGGVVTLGGLTVSQGGSWAVTDTVPSPRRPYAPL